MSFFECPSAPRMRTIALPVLEQAASGHVSHQAHMASYGLPTPPPSPKTPSALRLHPRLEGPRAGISVACYMGHTETQTEPATTPAVSQLVLHFPDHRTSVRLYATGQQGFVTVEDVLLAIRDVVPVTRELLAHKTTRSMCMLPCLGASNEFQVILN
ncbi:hypothetical protein EXIGLDRAFT_693535 [Exidia glandulosa HHB12029]|uniref:Uncharacterized protein n=1 Tax=Exidia glandulosa HHB12029 TaxID=1314781 RepID=A0A166MEU5_EXIGL|nr:hypothetical protein EXIGLDRAFT_693535 [Exidia glandulosa HHB12029]